MIVAGQHIIPLKMTNGMLTFACCKPTKDEEDNCAVVELTSLEQWDPFIYNKQETITEDQFVDLYTNANVQQYI